MDYLKEKLKRTKKVLKQWNKEVFSSFIKRKQELLAEIEELDHCDDEGTLQEDKRIKRVEILSQLRGMEEKELDMVRQKARGAQRVR